MMVNNRRFVVNNCGFGVRWMKPFFEKRMSRLRVSVYDGFSFPEHLHTQLEMMYLFSGSAEMMVDGISHSMRPGDLMLAFPNIVHGYRQSEDAHGLMMILSPECTGDFHAQLMASCPVNPLVQRARLRSDVAQVARAIEAEHMTSSDEAVQRAYMQVLLARAMPLLELRPQSSAGEQELLRRAMSYLSVHWREPVTLQDLAQQLGASKYHLSHLFSGRLHTNFRTYVNALRVERAQQMLRGSDASITDICYECGFESQRTFNRAFLQLTGSTPRMYRMYAEK